MRFSRPAVAGVVGVAACVFGASLAASPALTQEVEPPAPWVKLTSSHAGAVGTCSVVDATDNEACYMVRCDAKNGLIFEIGDATVGEMGLRSARFEIGRYKETRSASTGTVPIGERLFSQSIRSCLRPSHLALISPLCTPSRPMWNTAPALNSRGRETRYLAWQGAAQPSRDDEQGS